MYFVFFFLTLKFLFIPSIFILKKYKLTLIFPSPLLNILCQDPAIFIIIYYFYHLLLFFPKNALLLLLLIINLPQTYVSFIQKSHLKTINKTIKLPSNILSHQTELLPLSITLQPCWFSSTYNPFVNKFPEIGPIFVKSNLSYIHRVLHGTKSSDSANPQNLWPLYRWHYWPYKPLEMSTYGQCLSGRDRKEETQFRNIYALSHDWLIAWKELDDCLDIKY